MSDILSFRSPLCCGIEYGPAEKPEILVGAVEADDVDNIEGFLKVARLPALVPLPLLDTLGYPNDKGENGPKSFCQDWVKTRADERRCGR